MVVNDVWGQIRIESPYEGIINSREFNELKNKTQLGLNCNSNAIHTRYQHSIGTYYLACRLIDICKNKYSRILNITKEDEQAIKCMALVHDIGHGCFSHVSEKHLEGTHENRTESILLNPDSEVHQAIVSSFGQDILEKTVNLIKMKEKLKEKSGISNTTNLMLINAKLLSGGIDIDRIDYIFRDSKFVTGETNDFSSILESIELECIDDSLEIVFDEEAEFTIANYFNKRFELYDSLYFNNETRILESVFGKFLSATNTKINWETTEIEINNIFRENISCDDEVINRYAQLLNIKKLDKGFIIREINDEKNYNFYKNKLFAHVPELSNYCECVFESRNKISIYNKDNKVLINKSGLIKDISECSRILNSELEKEKYVIAVDITLLNTLLKRDNVKQETAIKIVEKILKATSLEIEQEKKYVFKSNDEENIKSGFQLIKNRLNLKEPEFMENHDIYYDDNNILETYRIAVRKRISNNQEEWNVKRPLNDKTSISKRDEKNFNSFEEVTAFLKNEWQIPINILREKVILKTSREKYDINYEDGSFEIVFDITIPVFNGEKLEPNYMIECELKNGKSSRLFFLNEIMTEFDFIEECNLSKKEIKNPFDILKESSEEYESKIKNFFVSSPELFEKLKILNDKKAKIKELKEKNGDLNRPIVVTLSGTPRAGKTTCIDNLFEFLKKADLKAVCLEEPAGLIYRTLRTKEEKKELLSDRVGFVEKQYEIGKNYIENKTSGNDIILCDRGIIDTFIWYDMYYQLGMISKEKYLKFVNQLNQDYGYYNQFYSLFANSEESMRRDYLSSLSLEQRTTMNQKNVERYNSSLLRMYPSFEKSLDYTRLIDTTNNDKMDASIVIANEVLDSVKKLYLKR